MKARIQVRGIEDVNEVLSKIAPNHARNIMRATVHGVASTITKDAKTHMSEDTGEMKKATKAKRERGKPDYIQSTVRVAESAFYWRFREYGQGPDGVEDAMFMKAVAKFQAQFDEIFMTQFVKKFEAAVARARKRQSNGN